MARWYGQEQTHADTRECPPVCLSLTLFSSLLWDFKSSKRLLHTETGQSPSRRWAPIPTLGRLLRSAPGTGATVPHTLIWAAFSSLPFPSVYFIVQLGSPLNSTGKHHP